MIQMNIDKEEKKITNYYFIFKGDLEHMRAVKQEKHNKFVKDKEMQSFMISAKTGESVSCLFYNR